MPKWEDTLSHSNLVKWITRIVGFALAVLLLVWMSYLVAFWQHPISSDSSAWGQFGDFVGGTANPLLGFLTLIVLALTIVLQSKQLSISSRELELSRRELELTRDELRRSAEAQEQSEKALKDQVQIASRSARLSAANFLLENYRLELKSMKGEVYITGDPRLGRVKDLEKRQAVLVAMLDDLYKEIVGGNNP